MSGGDIAIDLLWEQIRLFVLRVAVLSSLHYFNEPPTSNATTITTTTTAAAAAAATTTIVLHTISQLFYILEIFFRFGGGAVLYSLLLDREYSQQVRILLCDLMICHYKYVLC